MRRTRLGILSALGVFLALSGQAERVARADLRSADDKFLHGDYKGALAELKAIKGKEATKAKVRAGYVHLRLGEYAEAEKASQVKGSPEAGVLRAEVYRATGRLADARKVLEDLLIKNPKHLRAKAFLGLTYEDLGEKVLAESIWNEFYDAWDAGEIKDKDAEGIFYVGIAACGLEDFQGANQMLEDATALVPELVEAQLFWGWLFLEKYAAGEAEVSFDSVLKIDPHHPDAHAGMARVKLEQAYDYKAAYKHIAEALATNPRHAGALLIRAELEIDNAEYAAAEKTLKEVLAANPADLEAHTLLGTIEWLNDDLAGYEAERKIVFAANPKFARFYHIVAEFAVKEHRYREAIELEEKALEVDPKYYAALSAIGTGYLRLGDEEKGLKYLNDAFTRDKFNVRTFNTLNLFE
jgi:tetratricopeptide (TPR) repeat protein